MVNKKALSPVIATVLLILIVVIIAIIILLWARGFIKEQVFKFEDTAIEQTCGEVNFKASYSAGTLSLVNIGNINIHGFKIQKIKKGETEIDEGQKENALAIGESRDIEFSAGDYAELNIIPILLGKTEKGGVHEYTCPDNTGVSISLT